MSVFHIEFDAQDFDQIQMLIFKVLTRYNRYETDFPFKTSSVNIHFYLLNL